MRDVNEVLKEKQEKLDQLKHEIQILKQAAEIMESEGIRLGVQQESRDRVNGEDKNNNQPKVVGWP
jgi:hypothetical protein